MFSTSGGATATCSSERSCGTGVSATSSARTPTSDGGTARSAAESESSYYSDYSDSCSSSAPSTARGPGFGDRLATLAGALEGRLAQLHALSSDVAPLRPEQRAWRAEKERTAAGRPLGRVGWRELEGLQTAVSENMSTIEEIAEELEAHAAVAGQDAATTKAKLKERQLAERELRGRVDGARAARTKLLASLHAEAVAATEALAAEQATAARAAEKVAAETAASTAASASAAEARAREGEAQAAALARAAADAEKAVADLTAELAKAERTSAAIVREAAPELEGLRAAAATLATRRPRRRWRPSPAQLHGWLGALGKGEAMPVALGPTDAQKRWVLVVGQADGGGAALAVYKGTAAVVAGTAEGRVARLPLRRCWRIEAGGGSAAPYTITVAIAPADPPAAAAVDVDAPPGGVVALTAPGREAFARWFLALQALSAVPHDHRLSHGALLWRLFAALHRRQRRQGSEKGKGFGGFW
jgi:hypothetical protein